MNEEKSRGRKNFFDSVKYSDILYDIFDGHVGTGTQPGALLEQNGLK